MIHVICTKWGIMYPSEYVNKLFKGIQRNTTKEFSFTCFTEISNGIEHPEIKVEPLPNYTGDWYSKIGLYNKDLYSKDDQIFYFDLDTVITGSLDEIFDYKGNFIILKDPYNNDKYGSGLMSWQPEAVAHMWDNYKVGYKHPRGDQAWCEEQYPGADLWQDFFPNKIISYKANIRDSARPKRSYQTQDKGNLDTASIVYFHGKPRPHEVRNLEWMIKNW